MKLFVPLFRIVILLTGFMIIIASTADAQATGDYRSNAASFNWNTAASWQTFNGVSWVAAATYPGQAVGTGNVLVRSGQTVTINVSPANAIGSLTVNTGTLTFNVASSITLSVTGDVTVAAGTCTINVANAAGTNIHTLNIGGSLSVATGTTFDMTTAGDDHCNVIFNGAGNKTITVGSSTSVAKFYDLTINKSTAATTVTSQTYPFIVNHDLIVSVGNLILTASGSFYTVNNNLTVGSGSTLTHNASYNSVSANTTYVQVNGDLSINGTYTYTGFTPAIWMNSGGVTASHNINTGTTALCELFLRTGNFFANGPVTVNQDFYAMWNLVGGSFHTNGQTVNANWGLVNNGGTVYVDGGTLTVGATVGGMLVGRTLPPFNGDVQVSLGTLNVTGGGIYLGNGAAGTTIGTCTQSGGIINIALLDVGKSSTFTQSDGTNNSGNVILDASNSNYNQTTGTPTLNVTANLTNNGIVSTGTGTDLINIGGNWINNLTFTTSSTNTVTFNGGSSSDIGGSVSSIFNNLTINNAAGVTMSKDQTVNSTLTLTSGIFNIGSNNLILATTALAVAGSPFSSSKMIEADGTGTVRKNFSATGSYLFPIGDNTGTAEYSPITLNFTSGTFTGGAYAAVNVTDAKHPNNASTTDYLTRYWTLSNSGITSPSCIATATYVTADVAGTEANIAAAKYTGSLPWVKYGVIGSNTLTTTAITNTGAGIILTGISNFPPTVTISGGNITICPGSTTASLSSTVVNVTGSITYSWSPGVGLSSSTISNPVANPALTTTYTLTVTDGDGFTGTATTTITVGSIPATPTISAGGPLTFCAGGSVTLTSSAGTTYLWSTGATTSSISPTISGSYTVQVTNASGCQSAPSAATVVTVTPTNTAGAPSSTPTLCINTALTSITIATTGATAISNDGVAGANGLPAGVSAHWVANVITISGTPTASGTFNYSIPMTGGCGSVNATGTITVNPVSVGGTVNGSAAVCSGTNSGTLTLSGQTGSVIRWEYSTDAGSTWTTIVNTTTSQTYTNLAVATLYRAVVQSGTCASANSASASMTITAAPSASISYAGNPFCSNTGVALVTFSGSTGGTYSIAPAGGVINSVSGTVNLAASAPGSYTVTYTVAAFGGCSLYTTTTSILINPNTWTGGTSTDWNTGSNWASNGTANTCPDYTILSSVPYQPILNSGTATVQNLFINSGAFLTVANATLQISGTVNNSGTFDASNGTVEMNGTSAQTIPANTFQNNALYNLIISNNSVNGVSLGGALDIYGSLNYTGTGGVLNTNDNLTFKSTATNTAWLGDMTGNTITGKATVERYLPSRKAWRFLSVPTNTTQTIRQTWQEGAASTAANPVPGYGIQLSGSGGTGAGFDLYSATPSMKTYNSATGTWVGVSGTGINIKATTGYMVFVRGDRTANAFNSPVTQTTLRTKGPVYTGNQAAITVNAGQFTAIGNPYPSTIDMRNITKAGVKDFFYVWDAALAGAYGYGAYQTFSNNGSGNYIITPGGGSYGTSGSISNYIQSGQAFFVQGDIGGGSVTFKEAAKTTGSSVVSIAPSIPTPQIRANLYGINADNSTYMADGLLVNYDDNYSNKVDDLDAIKQTNTSENLSIKASGKLLVIERRHTITDKDTVFLNLTGVSARKYRFEFLADQLYHPGLTAFLLDNYLHTSTPLYVDGTTDVDFSVTGTAASYAANRFMIVFSQLGTLPVTFTSVKAYSKDKTINVQWTVENEMNMKQYETEKSTDGNQFTNLSITAATANGGHSANYLVSDTYPVQGYNYYRVKSVDINGKVAYSNIVKVMMGSDKQEISVYPNPVVNGIINLQLNNQPQGTYAIRVLNKSGQLILQKQVQHAGGSSTETISLDRYISKGVYQLEITRPDGTKSNISVVY